MATIWERLAQAREPTREERGIGAGLLQEYRQRGYVGRTCKELLGLPDGAFRHFYAVLGRERGVASPVAGRGDGGWMAEADFCFINVRATGLGEGPGSLLGAAKLLPGLRVNALHLGPFTDYDFGVIYAPRGLRTIAPQVVDGAAGVGPEEQLRALVEAAHMLGMAVGFDLEPHVAQYALPVLMRPELFRWLKLSPDRTRLDGGLTTEEMLARGRQEAIAAEVRAVVGGRLAEAGLDDLEAAEGDDRATSERRRQVSFGLIGELIGRGLWPMPSQSWAGLGVPAFGGYNQEGGYARFDYRSATGEDLSGKALHIATPFAFYHGMRPNRPPERAERNEAAIDFFCEIFGYWRDRFGFDFVRYDSVDHILDSLVDGDWGRPAADRPTPEVLQNAIKRARTAEQPAIGAMAERMGSEVEPYAAMGFDLMLGSDMLRRIDGGLLHDSFALDRRLRELNRGRATPFALPFCIDTHDTGDPAFWGEPLVKVVGAASMRLRHFVARFLGSGAARRPKYEVMGSQDLSYGLYRANVSEANLTWVGDEGFNRSYHLLEDIYARLRPLLDSGLLLRHHVAAGHGWWVIGSGAGLLAAVVALEGAEEVGTPHIDLGGLVAAGARVEMYDFSGALPETFALLVPSITVEGLVPCGFRLFVVGSA